MATFLELAKQVAPEAGIDPAAITAVTGLTGRPAKIVNWVRQAYNNIQSSRRGWGWLASSFSQALVPGTSVYTAASFNLTRFSSWVPDEQDGWYRPVTLYDPAIGIADEGPLNQITHDLWRTKYNRGDTSSTYWNRPIEWAISPRMEICFGPIPDAAYVVRGQYQKGPQTLTLASDIPEMPTRFHDMIAWEAVRLSMLHDGAYQEAQFPNIEMIGLRHALELDQLPEVRIP